MSSNEDTFDLLGAELDASFGDEPSTSVEEPEEKPEEKAPEVEEKPAEEKPTEEEEKPEEPEEPEVEPEKAEEEAPAVEPPVEEPAKSSKDDLKEALREIEAEKTHRQDTRNTLRDEVRSKLYPDGLERPILDSDNRPINGPQDMIGKLIDPETNEPFERDAAERWWNATKLEQDKAIESIEQDIDKIAETNQTLFEEYQQVAARFGEFIEANPEIAQRVLQSWERTLKKDPATGIVIEAPVSLYSYYDMVLSPQLQVSQQQAQAQATAEAEAAKQRTRAEQDDRSDLSPTAGSPKDNKKDSLDKAFDAYFAGK